MENRWEVIWRNVSVVIIIILSIIVFRQYKQIAQQAEYKKRFINHLYSQVKICIGVIPEEYDNIKEEQIQAIINELNRIDTILYDGSIFLDEQIRYYHYIPNFNDIGYMIHKYYVRKHLKVASKLDKLKKCLEDVKLKMSSEDTGQENPNLSIEEINNIFGEFLESYNQL